MEPSREDAAREDAIREDAAREDAAREDAVSEDVVRGDAGGVDEAAEGVAAELDGGTGAARLLRRRRSPRRTLHHAELRSVVPWFTIAVTVLATSVYAVELARPSAVTDLVLIGRWRSGAVRYGVEYGQWWRTLTWLVTHLSVGHLLGNLGAFAALGWVFERAFGTRAMVVVCGVCAAGVTAAVLAFDPATATAGLSGVVLGLAGAVLVVERRRQLRLMPYLAPLVALVLVLSAAPGTSLVAHLGGLVVGVGVGWLVPGRERTAVLIGVALAGAAFLV